MVLEQPPDLHVGCVFGGASGIGSDCRPRAFGEVDGPVRRRLFGDCRVRSGPGHLAALPTRGASRGPSTSYRAPSSENYFRPELEHALAHWSHSREKLGPLCASTQAGWWGTGRHRMRELERMRYSSATSWRIAGASGVGLEAESGGRNWHKKSKNQRRFSWTWVGLIWLLGWFRRFFFALRGGFDKCSSRYDSNADRPWKKSGQIGYAAV